MSPDLSTKKQKLIIPLKVEKGNNVLWGRVKVNSNLIVGTADTIEKLKVQLKELILHFENVEVEEFKVIMT